MSTIVINPNVPLVAVQGVTADVILQPGTVISAQVQQILGNGQVQISIGGQSIVVVSQVPLQAGQTLQLSVSQAPDGSIELALVNPGLGAAGQTIADLASAGLTADLVALTPGAIANLAAPTTAGRGRCTQSAHATASPRGNGRRPGRGNPADQSGAAVCRPQRGCRRERPATAGSAGHGASAGAAHQPRPEPDRRRHQAGVPEFRPVSGSLAGVGIGGVICRAGPQGGADRAAPGADDLAQRRGADAGHHNADAGHHGAAATATAAQPGSVVPSEATPAAVQVSSLPVTITAEPDTSTAVSPALVPLLAPEIVEPEVLLQGTASPLSQGVSDFGAANAVMSSPATTAAAVARAAVSSAALNLLQEAVQAGPLELAEFVKPRVRRGPDAVTGCRR